MARRAKLLMTTSILVGLLVGLLAGCGASEAAAEQSSSQPGGSDSVEGLRSDGLFRVVATTTQASDLMRILGKGVSDIQITGLMGAGVDPHLYQPTESDISAMNIADMVVYSGLHLEGQFDTVFKALGEQGVDIYAMGDPVKRAGFVVGSGDGADDPHFWFDPRNWQVTVADLAKTLGEIDPDHAGIYQENADEYVQRLDELYQWAKEGMQSVDEGLRYLVTSHDAFRYFGAALGWQMAAIQGISTEDEAGVGDIQGTVDFVMENQIPVLFVESSIPPQTINAVRAAIESEGRSVDVGVRELFGDAMDAPDAFGGTYIGMLAHNVLTILQSYIRSGAAASIPEWPDGLPAIPAEMLVVEQRSESE